MLDELVVDDLVALDIKLPHAKAICREFQTLIVSTPAVSNPPAYSHSDPPAYESPREEIKVSNNSNTSNRPSPAVANSDAIPQPQPRAPAPPHHNEANSDSKAAAKVSQQSQPPPAVDQQPSANQQPAEVPIRVECTCTDWFPATNKTGARPCNCE